MTDQTGRGAAPALTLTDDDRRLVGAWAADCAERVLALFEANAAADVRPRDAIEGVRAFAAGGRRTARLRGLALAALAAAREIGDPAAAAAARAAGIAASTAYTHALATPDQAKHVLGPGAYAARARELAASDDPGAADAEIRWAVERASPAVREITGRWPARERGQGRLDALLYALDAGLRGSPGPNAAAK